MISFKKKVSQHIFYYLMMVEFFLLLTCSIGFARNIIILPLTKIEKDTVYKNVHLDLNHGSFLILNQATLKIENCIIHGDISATNHSIINVANGNLILRNNVFNISASTVAANPSHPPLYYAINVSQGEVNIDQNKFIANLPYTVGLMSTNRQLTSNFVIKNNSIHNFHGGILLRNSSHALILNNEFFKVSSGNIFILEGSNNVIKRNSILFAGNNNIGDAVDISDSENISLVDNYILAGSCYSVVILRGKNIIIDHNIIVGGITYALFIAPAMGHATAYQQHIFHLLGTEAEKNLTNQHIVITNNYFSQNRYGLAGNKIDGLIVKDNIFIQRFSDNNGRKFWTNMDTLLQDTINITWDNNRYKEAYSQEFNGNNDQSSRLVLLPLHGGVVL